MTGTRLLWLAALRLTRGTPLQRWAYRRYLRSAEWRRNPARAAAFRRAAGRCEGEGVGGGRCAARRALQAHHVTYRRVGLERPADFRVLCNHCHHRAHKGRS